MAESLDPTELLILTHNLSQVSEVLQPSEAMPFRRYWKRRLGCFARQIGAELRAGRFGIWVDGQVVTDPDSQISVRRSSEIALVCQRGDTIDIVTCPRLYQADLN